MVEVVDAQKVRARSELDKMHQGLVIGLESRTSGKLAAASQSAGKANAVDVPLAINMVKEALDTLASLRDLAARQQSELENTGAENARLRHDLDALQQRYSEMQSQVAMVRLENQNLNKSLSKEQDERQKLQELQGQTEGDLKSLVEVITESFHGRPTQK